MANESDRLQQRRAEILKAVVAHFIGTGEPAGSKTIVERFGINASSATVRNELAALEDMGLLYQPHTSAGRVPTDAGYRYFVDELGVETRLSAPDARRIQAFFGEARWELEESLRQTAGLLSQLTDHAALVFSPVLERSVVRHVELVALSGNRAMIVLVTNTGRVENHVVQVPNPVDDVQLERASEMMNRIAVDAPLEQAARKINEAIGHFPLELREVVTAVAKTLDDEIADRGAEIYLEGTSNIVDEHKFADLETVRQVIGALEHRRLVLEVFADGLATNAVSVRIGSENAIEEMRSCAVITAPYGDDSSALGSIGIVGPTRMDYRRTIAAVHEVASNLGRMLAG